MRTVLNGAAKKTLMLVSGLILAAFLALGVTGCGCGCACDETTTTLAGPATTVAAPSTTIRTTTTAPATTTTGSTASHKRAATTTMPPTSTTAAPNAFAGAHNGSYVFNVECFGPIVFVVGADGIVVGTGSGYFDFVIHGTVTAAGVLSASGPVEYDGGPRVISLSGTFTAGGASGGGGLSITDDPYPNAEGTWAVPGET